jgi:hypothetical protein
MSDVGQSARKKWREDEKKSMQIDKACTYDLNEKRS